MPCPLDRLNLGGKMRESLRRVHDMSPSTDLADAMLALTSEQPAVFWQGANFFMSHLGLVTPEIFSAFVRRALQVSQQESFDETDLSGLLAEISAVLNESSFLEDLVPDSMEPDLWPALG
jgi:hypothetical protein